VQAAIKKAGGTFTQAPVPVPKSAKTAEEADK
jgi:hypothetical protein